MHTPAEGHPALATPPLGQDEPFVADFVLAGAGVIRADRVGDLKTFAEQTGLGVLNTFTAKGLFRWDSPYHLGTGCLQERDLALAGAGPGSAVLVVGVEQAECVPALLRAAGVDPALSGWRTVAPDALAEAASRVRARSGGPPALPQAPELFAVLWDVAQPLYAIEGAPLNPARGSADVATALGPQGVVCTEPGQAGWWVARTVPTTRLGSVCVPAVGEPGRAVADALALAERWIPSVAVVDGPLSTAAEELIERGRSRGLSFVVEVWGEAGEPVGAAEHRSRTQAALGQPQVTVLEVPIDFSATEQLIAAAGPLVAWTSASAWT